MSYRHQSKRRDKNEAGIVEALRAVGASVTPLDGAGVPDLLVGFRGHTYLLEVKNPDQKGGSKYNTGDGCLTDDQTRWLGDWCGERPTVVFTAAEALRAIGAMS